MCSWLCTWLLPMAPTCRCLPAELLRWRLNTKLAAEGCERLEASEATERSVASGAWLAPKLSGPLLMSLRGISDMCLFRHHTPELVTRACPTFPDIFYYPAHALLPSPCLVVCQMETNSLCNTYCAVIA